MKTESIVKLIEAADKMRSEIVLCLMGAPGIGKTEAVELFAERHDRKIVHMIASQILPTEVSGITMPDSETESMKVYDHARLASMKDGDILFLDELLKGQQQVLNACLTLIQERRLMSGRKLPDILIIAAANPLASVAQLPIEIRQRFMFVDVEWSQASWVEYMMRLGFENEDAVTALSTVVKKKRGSTSEWNTLTPRTATKLCLWMRSAQGCPEQMNAVRAYIKDSFGIDVLEAISDAMRPPKERQISTGYDTIIEMINSFDSIDDESKREIIDMAEGMKAVAENKLLGDEPKEQMFELIKKLKSLDEWDEIEKALKDIVL